MNVDRKVARVTRCYELTRRERQVLEHLVRGRTEKRVAAKLGIRLDTVRTHVAHIYLKLGVHSRSELFALIYDVDDG